MRYAELLIDACCYCYASYSLPLRYARGRLQELSLSLLGVIQKIENMIAIDYI